MKPLIIQQQTTYREETDSFTRYLRDVSIATRDGVLTKEEEGVLFKRIQRGDMKAEKELIVRNLRFVISVAKQYHVLGCKLDDLIEEGNSGLIIAARKFDYNSENRFISYAIWWIRQYILVYLNKNARAIRIPTNKLTEIYKIKKAEEALEQKLGRPVTAEEIIDSLANDKHSDHIFEYISIYGGVKSLNDVIPNSDDGATFEDYIKGDDDVEKHINEIDLKKTINRLLSIFSKRNKLLMELYYGLNNKEAMNVKDIADYFDIEPHRVNAIKNDCIWRLKLKSKHFSFD